MIFSQFAFEAAADNCMTHWTAVQGQGQGAPNRKTRNSRKLPLLLLLLLPFTCSSKTLIFVVLFLDPSGIFSLLDIFIKLPLERYLIAVLMLIHQIRSLQVEFFFFAVSSTWHILSVRLPFFLFFRSSWSLDLRSLPAECVWECVCMSAAGQLVSWLWLMGCALI